MVYLAELAACDESSIEAYKKDAKVTDLAGRHILLDGSCVALAHVVCAFGCRSRVSMVSFSH